MRPYIDSGDDTLGAWFSYYEIKLQENMINILLPTFQAWDGEEEPTHLLTREEWLKDPWFSKPFDAGYGSQGCPAFVVWTENWILNHHEYDGSDSIDCIPRHPSAKKEP